MTTTVASLEAVFGADISGFMSGARGVESSLESLGNKTSKLGAALGVVFGAGAAGLGFATNEALGFNREMTNAAAAVGLADDELQAWSDTVLATGGVSLAGPQAAALAFYDIVGGVQDATKWQEIYNASLMTSDAGRANLTATTATLVATENAYGEASLGAAHNADVMTRMVGMGVGTMDEFASAVPEVIGLTSELGITFDEAGSTLAFYTTKGMSAAKASTLMKAGTIALLNPNEKLLKVYEDLGVESGSLLLSQYGLAGAMNYLTTEGGLTTDQLAQVLGSTEALQGAIPLLGDEFTAFSDKFGTDLDGITAKTRAIQLEGPAAQFDLFKSKMQETEILIGNALLPSLNELLTVASPILSAIGAWAAANPALAATIGEVVIGGAALSGVLMILGPLLTATSALIGLMATPLGIGLFLAGAYATNLYGFRDSVGAVSKELQDGDLAGLIGAVGSALLTIPKGIAIDLGGLIGVDVQAGLDSWKTNLQMGGDILQVLPGYIDRVVEKATGFSPGEAWSQFEQTVTQIKNGVGSVANRIYDVITAGAQVIIPPGVMLLSDTWKVIKDTISPIAAFVGDFVTAMTTVVLPSAVTDLMTTFQGIHGAIDGLAGFVKDFAEAISKIEVPGPLKEVAGLISSIASAASSISNLGGIGSIIPGLASGGPVDSGGLYVVGEKGPELFVPGANGSIIPNNQLNRSLMSANAPRGNGEKTGQTFSNCTFVLQGIQDANALFEQLKLIETRRA